VKYFFLDAKGCLIYEQGVPKCCKSEPFGIPAAQTDAERQAEAEAPEQRPLTVQIDPQDNLPGIGNGFTDFNDGNSDNDFTAYEGWNLGLL
jgi:hypothetical protein